MARRMHRTTCPACGTEPDRMVVIPQEIIRCPGCGLETSFHEWQTHAGDSLQGTGRVSVVRETSANGDIHWAIPAGRNAGVSMTFWGLWCVLSLGLMAFVVIKCFPQYGITSLLLLLSFPIPFLVIGIIFLHLSVVRHHEEYRITLTKDTLESRRNLLGRLKLRIFPRSRIRSISRITTSKSGSTRSEAVEIRAGKDRIQLGEHLSPEERQTLVDEMRLLVFGPPVTVPSAVPSTVAIPGSFSFLVRHRMLHYLPFASVSILMGAFFMAAVIRFWSHEPHSSQPDELLFFRVIEWVATLTGNVMRGVFMLIALGMISGGLWMWIHALRKHLRQTVLEGNAGRIIVRMLDKRGRQTGEKTYPRHESDTIRTSIQSMTGGVTLKRIELLRGDDSTPLVSDVRSEDAEAIMNTLSE